MVSLKSVAVHVEKPDGISVGKFFGNLQSWLDANKIEPLNFRVTGGWTAGLDVCFSSTEQAERFQAAFTE